MLVLDHAAVVWITVATVTRFQAAAEDIEDAFKSAGILSDMHLSDAPDAAISTLKYGNNEVEVGEQLDRDQTAQKPGVLWHADPSKKYVLFMTDLDPPSPKNPSKREWLHWLVANIPGNRLSEGTTLIQYAKPTPPEGTHRYVFLVYEQPEGKTIDDTPSGRPLFETVKYASKHNLVGPVFGSFIRVPA